MQRRSSALADGEPHVSSRDGTVRETRGAVPGLIEGEGAGRALVPTATAQEGVAAGVKAAAPVAGSRAGPAVPRPSSGGTPGCRGAPGSASGPRPEAVARRPGGGYRHTGPPAAPRPCRHHPRRHYRLREKRRSGLLKPAQAAPAAVEDWRGRGVFGVAKGRFLEAFHTAVSLTLSHRGSSASDHGQVTCCQEGGGASRCRSADLLAADPARRLQHTLRNSGFCTVLEGFPRWRPD